MFFKGLVSSFPRNIKTKKFYCMQTCNISAFSLQQRGTGFLLCIHLVCLSISLSFSLYHLVKRATDYWKQLQSLLQLRGLSYQFVRCRTTPEDSSCPNLLERDWRHSEGPRKYSMKKLEFALLGNNPLPGSLASCFCCIWSGLCSSACGTASPKKDVWI